MPYRFRLLLSSIVLVTLIGLGASGFHWLEGWAWVDAFYATIITLATVGYGDLVPKTPGGKLFTAGLVLTGVGVLGYVASTGVQALIQSELLLTYGRRRMFRDISQLSDHFILCGAGRVGLSLIKEMQRKGVDFVVIERDEHQAERLLSLGYLTLNGDATDEETLLGARIDTARGLVCCTSSDAVNVYITLTARGLNEQIYIVARAFEESAVPKLRKAGADRIVSPVQISSHQITEYLLRPAVGNFLELTLMSEETDLEIEQVTIAADSPLVDKKLKDSGLRTSLNVIVIAINRAGHEKDMEFNPKGDTELHAEDALIVIGDRTSLETLEKMANPSAVKGRKPARRKQ